MTIAETLPLDLSILARLIASLVLGGVVGWEREAAGKAAGVRTHMLVAFGATLFVALGDALVQRFAVQQLQGAEIRSDPVRIIEAVVTGVSFLGAGTIFVTHGRERVEGLTTAASMWATTGIGIAVGLERYILAAGSTLLVFIVLKLIAMLPIEGDQQARIARERKRESESEQERQAGV